MTIASEVKQCRASLRGIEAGLSSLALGSQDHKTKQTLYETMLIINEIVVDLEKRIGVLELDEPQYEGF